MQQIFKSKLKGFWGLGFVVERAERALGFVLAERAERVLGFAKKTWGRDKFGLFQWSFEVKTCFWACLLFVKL